jgi:hypothetical protein
MDWDATTWMLTGAMACAALGAWLTGALVHVGLIRASRSGGRRVLRMGLPMDAEQAETAVMATLGASGHYLLAFTGRMEDTLLGEIHSTEAMNAHLLARLFCRVDDVGEGQSRVQVRLDFADLLDRTRRATAVVLWIVWPLWISAVAAGVGLFMLRAEDPRPWLLLHGFHATYPLLAMPVLLSLYRRRRRRIGEAVSAALRAVRHSRPQPR